MHLAILGAILWLLQRAQVTPKAINRSKITLDLSQIQTLPPKPPAALPSPKVPPRPTPKPRLKKPPAPHTVHRPTPKPEPKPTPPPKKTEPKQTPAIRAETNATEAKEKKKVIVMKITPRHREPKAAKRPPRKKSVKKAPTKRLAAKKPTSAARRHTAAPRKRTTRRRSSRPRPRGPDSRLISRLYGSSYSRMSSAQRRFIDENLRRILQISQRTLNYLGYPREAARFGQEGTNVVEFWLHPNGDISGLRLRRRLRSSALNRQTLEVIRTAYMHYPRPRVKTKIIIYVRYSLY